MLSYRHAFHAGNFADVIKHLVLVNTLSYVTRKAAPLFYLDTHAGAGLYRLNSVAAEKTREAEAGILRLDFAALLDEASAEGKLALQNYQNAVQPFVDKQEYPGSPLLAAALLRRQDHLHLSELHPADFARLQQLTRQDKRIECEQADGYLSINARLPPVQKRAIVLIDPSYELKEDYVQVVRALVEIYRRMPAAHVLLWYPVIERSVTDRLINALQRTEIRDLWQFELGMEPDTRERGLTSSGMLVLNPPWTLPEQMRNCLPLVQQQLSPVLGHWLVENLVSE